MQPIKDHSSSYEQMAIVEKYESVISYLYPIAQSIPTKQKVVREMFIQRLLALPEVFIDAGKIGHLSKLNAADAGLAKLRYWLRLLHSEKVRAISSHQVEVAQVLISEVGKMTGAWIKKANRKGQSG